MSDFTVNIDSTLDLTAAEGKIKSFLSQYDNKKVTLKVDTGNVDASINGVKSKLKGMSSERIKLMVDTGQTVSNLAKVEAQFNRLKGAKILDNTTFANAYSDLQKLSNTKLDEGNIEQYNTALKTCQNYLSAASAEMSKFASSTQVTNLLSRAKKQLQENSAYTKEAVAEMKGYIQEIESLGNNMTKLDYSRISNSMKTLHSNMDAAGKTGRSLSEELGRGFKVIGQFAYTYGAIDFAEQKIIDAVNELKEVDSILTEISKTSDLTNAELKTLGSTAFESASEYGKTATDYLTGVQEMSRSGFYGEQAEGLARLSILGQAAGDMTADVSNAYLLATNAAYEYGGSVEKLNAVLDGQNLITNRNSVSMDDLASATTESASMAAQAGVQIDELSALIGTAVSRTKESGSEVGTALRSLFVNLQNTQSDKIVSTFDSLGISMTKMVGDTKSLKTPIELLRELAEVYNELPDGSEQKANILTNIGGKYHANTLSSILVGISSGDLDSMLQDYSEGLGSAAAEAEKSANNWEGSVNKLSNAWTSLIQNFANSDVIITVTNALTGLVKGIDSVASFPSLIGLLGGKWTTKNGLGKNDFFKYYSLQCPLL